MAKPEEKGIELVKHPETEMEYWQTIEGLGGMAWHLNHDLAHGRIDDPKGLVSEDVHSLGDLSRRLVEEIEEKFGVIPPDKMPKREAGQELPPAPEGKTWYWDWYNQQKLAFHEHEYNGLICSVCPFSTGVEDMARLSEIPCSLHTGALYKLRKPWICGLADPAYRSNMKPVELYTRILVEYGVDRLVTFRQKEVTLEAFPKPNSFSS